MNYWLFLIMYERPFGKDLWESEVAAGIAAQHYPAEWTNEAQNVNALKEIRRGDSIVAAFTAHRFAGYGVLTSDFFQGGKSLEIYSRKHHKHLESHERFNCDWAVLPLDSEKPYIARPSGPQPKAEMRWPVRVVG